MEITEKEDFVEKYDEDSNDDGEDSYDGDDGDYSDDGDDGDYSDDGDDGDDGDYSDDGDNESDDSDDEIDSPHEKGSSYMNSAFYLLFNLICIMFGWWLGAKGYGKHLIKNPPNVNQVQ